jgi:hypothetical protein
MPSKIVWVSLYKKHRVGSILKEGTKRYKVLEIVGPAPHGAYGTKLKLMPEKRKNPSIRKTYGTKGTFKKNFMKKVNETYKKLGKKKNPSELLKSGQWTPAHAVRVHKGKLEILN